MPVLIQDIKDSFDLSKVTKRTSVLGLSAVAFTLLSVRYPPVQPYAWLFLAFVAVASIHQQHTGKDILRYKAWELRRIFKPIAAGLMVALPIYIAVGLMSGLKVNGSWRELFLPVVAWTVAVATTEEFGFRFVLLRTLRPYSIVFSNVGFALIHPVVWDSFGTGNAAGIWFFLAYLLFGLAMTVIVLIYDHYDGEGTGAWFGPLMAITLHGAHNFFIIVFYQGTGGAALAPC